LACSADLENRRNPIVLIRSPSFPDIGAIALQIVWPWQNGVLNPHGPIGAAERVILLDATAIMLAVVLPVIALTLAVAWWFRMGNARAAYLPDWQFSGRVEVVVWSIPTLIIAFLGGMAWIGSHDLDPGAEIRSQAPAIDIQVVSLDWKWLFIYPALGVASVNRLVVPAGAPLRLELTSASVMNSFLVPELGSQIYAMSGMATRLQLLAVGPGTYPGLSAQFSGDGFSDMRFDLVALDRPGFDDWVKTTRSGGDRLDAQAYARLARPGNAAAPSAYGDVAPGLFEAAIADSSKPAVSDAMPAGK
jgi:cytochrome o ubiquinol oxidase subunit 2